MRSAIVLIGMPGVGKSTVGALLAKRRHLTFVNPDDLIIQHVNQSLHDFIDSHSEKEFLEIEHKILSQLVLQNTVIAPGGSIVYHPKILEIWSKKTTIIFLDASISTLQAVIDPTNRGIIWQGVTSLDALYQNRHHEYQKWAHFTLDCDAKTPGQIVDEIEKLDI